VISPDKGDALGVSHLEGKQEKESLHRVVPSIHEIAHEEVVSVRALTTHFEKFFEVVKLAMDVTTNLLDWVKGIKEYLLLQGLKHVAHCFPLEEFLLLYCREPLHQPP
jgi:hypothetical protein